MTYLITIPEEHVDALRRELARAHAERADAIRRALDHYLDTHQRLDDVEGAVVELGDLAEALDQLGFRPGATRGDVALTIHPEVLADALNAANIPPLGLTVNALAAEDERVIARVARVLMISRPDASVGLALLGGSATARSLEADFGLSPAGAAALIDRLHRHGLICCEPDLDDPRRARLHLSPGARTELVAALASDLDRIAPELSAAEREELAGWLTRE
jgi:DNA-binding MarR family transcriptional regulator